MKRILLSTAFAALILSFTAGCIVINVSRGDDKKPRNTDHHEEIEVEKSAH